MTLASAIAAIDYVELLTHTCTIGRPTVAGETDGGDDRLEYTTDTDTGVICRPDPVKSSDLVAISGRLVNADYRLFLLESQAIGINDRITVMLDADGVSVPGVFEAMGKPDDAAAQGHHKEVLIQAVN